MEKMNTRLRYIAIHGNGHRTHLAVVIRGNMTDAMTERLRKAVANGFDFDPTELGLPSPSLTDKTTAYGLTSFSATSDFADGDISCEDFVSYFEKSRAPQEGEKNETARFVEHIDPDTRAYKLKQLRMMLSQETAVGKTHYGAKLSHWHSDVKTIDISACALRALIAYYESLPTTKA